MKIARRRIGIAVVAFLSIGIFCPDSGAEPILKVPDGFTVRKVAGSPAIRFPMFTTFDDRGRLFVAESSGLDLYKELQQLSRTCRVSLLEDQDGDGVYEKAAVFAEKLVFPMGLAWRDGKLYVADPPDLIALEDTDGDGRADRRTVVLTGFGHSDNGSLHGLVFGPDDWLYMTMGNPDGYKLKGADGRTISGESGALIRCKPDGSDVEVICRGFENLVEIVFLPGGEMVGTDNWFSLPSEGVRDALMQLIEGGIYPLHTRDKGTPFLVSGDPLPAIAMYPAVAKSGLMRYRGTAFPGMRDQLFSAEHNTRKIVRHQLRRTLSNFSSDDSDFVSTDDPDFHPSDVSEDPDGSLLVVDTGSWYIHHCPTGGIRRNPAEGGLYRVRSSSKRMEDPRGDALKWNVAVAETARRLSDPRPAVRDRAVLTLVRAGEGSVPPLRELLEGTGPAFAKEAALWTLCRIGNSTARQVIRERLSDVDPELVILAARVCARLADRQAAPRLTELLRVTAPEVRLAAAESLARCGGAQVAPAIFSALSEEADAFLEHALILVLHRWASNPDLMEGLTRENPRVQRACLVLLDQEPRRALRVEQLIPLLSSGNEALRRAGHQSLAKHGEWSGYAAPLVSEFLVKKQLSPAEEAALRDLIVGFYTNSNLVQMIADVFEPGSKCEDYVRVILLDTFSRLPAERLPAAWKAGVKLALGSRVESVRGEAIRCAGSLQLPEWDSALENVSNDPERPSTLRVAALHALIRRHPRLEEGAFELLLRELSDRKNPLKRLAAMEVVAAAELNGIQLDQFFRTVRGDALVGASAIMDVARRGNLSGPGVVSLIETLRTALELGGQLPPEQLAWLEEKIAPPEKSKLAELAKRIATRDEEHAAEFQRIEPLLSGGDPNRGQEIFLRKATCATCHRVGKIGGTVGPDLTKIGAIRSGRDVLQSVLMPSATFAQGYEPYRVTLKNGDTLTGIRARQLDGSNVLREASGTETRLREAEIASMERLPLSIMPEGLLSTLSREEIRDLFAYLRGLK
jgi:putative membrane-bound dehydrogenase-like protein